MHRLLLIVLFVLMAGCRHGIDPNQLLDLSPGMSIAEVQRCLGDPGIHQFTAEIHGDEVIGLRYQFRRYYPLYLVFHDDALERARTPPEWPRHWVDRDGVKSGEYSPVEPEERMHQVLAAPRFDKQIANGLIEYWATTEEQRRYRDSSGESGNLGPMPIMFSPLIPLIALTALIENEVQNDRISEIHPLTIKIGMTPDKINAIVGEPRCVIDVGETGTVMLHGPWRGADSTVDATCQNIAITYRDDRVTRVFSHDFLDTRLFAD